MNNSAIEKIKSQIAQAEESKKRMYTPEGIAQMDRFIESCRKRIKILEQEET